MSTIRSSSNAAVRRARAVAAGREREKLLLEGARLVRDALRSGWALEEVLVSDERGELEAELEALGQAPLRVAHSLLASVSRLRTAPGVLAVAAVPPPAPWSVFRGAERSLAVVVAGVADPGNLGALARTAEAAGAEGLVTLAGGARPWSSKALRGSMGSLLRLPVVDGAEAERARAELDERGYRHVAAATRGGLDPADFDWGGPVALWIASETGGLPAAAGRPEPVSIPMAGEVESLNVTAAASILLFAAGRNRSAEA